jgi:hypothetical protein
MRKETDQSGDVLISQGLSVFAVDRVDVVSRRQ